MAGATLTTLSNVLKDMYLPPVVEQLNSEVLLLQILEARSQELFGRQAVVPLHYGRSGGIGARPENGALPNPGNQAYNKAVYDLKYLYGRVRVTGPSMAKTRSEVGSFLEVLKSELDGIRVDLKKDTARQLYGTGDGKIATCGTTTSSTTVVLGASGTEAAQKGQIYAGQVIDIGTLANPVVVVSGATISSVASNGLSIVIDSSVTTSSSHFVFRSGSVAASSVSYETTGLQQVIATTAGSLGGIDAAVAGNEWWDNQRDTAGGALTLDNLVKFWNKLKANQGETSHIVTSLGLVRTYFNLLQSQVRYNEPMKLKGGFEALDFMQKPFISDYEAPYGKIHFLDARYLKIFTNQDWHFLNEDGNVLKWYTGYDAFEAVLARYMNLGASRRNAQGVMSGLTDTTGY